MSLASVDLHHLSLAFDQIAPVRYDSVYKSECSYCFHTQESPNGLLIDMCTGIAFCENCVMINYQRTTHYIYLNVKKTRAPKPKVVASDEPVKFLGLGVPGGFFDYESNFELVADYAIVLLPQFQPIPIVNQDLPLKLKNAVDNLLTIEDHLETICSNTNAFEIDAERKESRYAANLSQLDNGIKIACKDWQCERCELKTNLWLNLSDGLILCGRKQFNQSGGNGHALEHFNETKRPLVVKLGTISPDGLVDVYSYAPDENDFVIDPYLEDHLCHWGIDLKEMKKTEKTTTELEIQLQNSFEWFHLSEHEKQLQPIYGSGFTGMINLGNTCYLASVIQVLFSIKEFKAAFYDQASYFFEQSNSKLPPTDFCVQMAKLASGLLSGNYSTEPSPEELAQINRKRAQQISHLLPSNGERDNIPEGSKNISKVDQQVSNLMDHYDDTPKFYERGIRPLMFKKLVGADHHEFSTNRQQDAAEFFSYLFTLISRCKKQYPLGNMRHQSISNLVCLFQFDFENRIFYPETNEVHYSVTRNYDCLILPIPLERATNNSEYQAYLNQMETMEKDRIQVDDPSRMSLPHVRPKVSLLSCLNAYMGFPDHPELNGSFWQSRKVDENSNSLPSSIKVLKFLNMPKYLVIQICKFEYGKGWIPKKMDILVDLPDLLDLESYRAQGLQPGEVLIKDKEINLRDHLQSSPKTMDLDDTSQSKHQKTHESPTQELQSWHDQVVNGLTEIGIPIHIAREAAHATLGKDICLAAKWCLQHAYDGLTEELLNDHIMNALIDASKHGDSVEFANSFIQMGFDKNYIKVAMDICSLDYDAVLNFLISESECLPPSSACDDDIDSSLEPSPFFPPYMKQFITHESSADQVNNLQGSLDDSKESQVVEDDAPEENDKNKNAKYELFAFISHIGNSTMCGHYICHIKNNGQWILFNDDKVLISQNPPRESAYLCVYRRINAPCSIENHDL